jgi:hypothetical protein
MRAQKLQLKRWAAGQINLSNTQKRDVRFRKEEERMTSQETQRKNPKKGKGRTRAKELTNKEACQQKKQHTQERGGNRRWRSHSSVSGGYTGNTTEVGASNFPKPAENVSHESDTFFRC